MRTLRMPRARRSGALLQTAASPARQSSVATYTKVSLSFFIAEVVKETRRLHQGPGTEKTTDIGSMSSERQLRIVERHVNQAD